MEDYCLEDILPFKRKSQYLTRSGELSLLEQGDKNKYSNGRFLNMTAKIWNECPKEIKEEKQFERAKFLIKEYCKTLPI